MARVDSELQGVREINALFQRPQGQEHEVSSASYAHRVSSFERDLEMMEQRVSSFVRCALPPPPLASLSLSLSLSLAFSHPALGRSCSPHLTGAGRQGP